MKNYRMTAIRTLSVVDSFSSATLYVCDLQINELGRWTTVQTMFNTKLPLLLVEREQVRLQMETIARPQLKLVK
jgi:hypothetical protein